MSIASHALFLLLVGLWVFATSQGIVDVPAAAGTAAAGLETSALVDLTSIDTVLPAEIVPAPAATPVPEPLTGPFADQSNAASHPASSVPAGAADQRRPAPDRGTGLGRNAEDPAWRRDATTLHERLDDGADTYQPSHAPTAARATSPEAVRREARTGLGDSTQTRRAQQAPLAARSGVADPARPGAGDTTTDGAARLGPTVAANPVTADARRTTILASSEGPLDANQGTRSFDVEAPAFVATDNRAVRAASREDHPGITDLTLAATPGNSSQGRGPSDMPGAVAAPSAGTAPSKPAPHPSGASGVGNGAQTQERRYDHYRQEIGDRVNKALVWPRRLAVRLEQGQTILRFVVQPDGKLGDSIQVIKSSGFAEFDQAALEAVRKALPFRPMPDLNRGGPLRVTLPVTFSNPVIR